MRFEPDPPAALGWGQRRPVAAPRFALRILCVASVSNACRACAHDRPDFNRPIVTAKPTSVFGIRSKSNALGDHTAVCCG